MIIDANKELGEGISELCRGYSTQTVVATLMEVIITVAVVTGVTPELFRQTLARFSDYYEDDVYNQREG